MRIDQSLSCDVKGGSDLAFIVFLVYTPVNDCVLRMRFQRCITCRHVFSLGKGHLKLKGTCFSVIR